MWRKIILASLLQNGYHRKWFQDVLRLPPILIYKPIMFNDNVSFDRYWITIIKYGSNCIGIEYTFIHYACTHHQLIMPPSCKDCSNTFLERSFIYAAPCEWNKLSEQIRTSCFYCFRKSVKTMLFTQQNGCWL